MQDRSTEAERVIEAAEERQRGKQEGEKWERANRERLCLHFTVFSNLSSLDVMVSGCAEPVTQKLSCLHLRVSILIPSVLWWSSLPTQVLRVSHRANIWICDSCEYRWCGLLKDCGGRLNARLVNIQVWRQGIRFCPRVCVRVCVFQRFICLLQWHFSVQITRKVEMGLSVRPVVWLLWITHHS